MAKPKDESFHSWKQTLTEVVDNWNRHGASAQSAALAFYTIFSLAPVLVVVIALAGAFFGEEAVRGQIFSEFEGMMGPQAALLVQEVLKSAARPESGRFATALGIGTLLFGATAVFVQLQDALNRVWGVAPKPGAVFTTLLRKRLLSFAVLLSVGFLLIVSLVLSAALTALSSRLEALLHLQFGLLQLMNFLISLFVITLLFALIYRLLPDVRLAGRDVLLGALATSLLFVIGKTAIGHYLGAPGAPPAPAAAVRPRQDGDRPLPRTHERRLRLRRGGLAGDRAPLGLLLLPDLLLRRRAHLGPFPGAPRQPGASRGRRHARAGGAPPRPRPRAGAPAGGPPPAAP